MRKVIIEFEKTNIYFQCLYEVQKEYEQNKGDISKYRDKMLCPECQIANLRFTHKTSERRAF